MTSFRSVVAAAGLVVAAAIGLPTGTASAEPSDPSDTGSSSSEANTSTGGSGSATASGTGQEPADSPTTSADTNSDIGPTVTAGGQEPTGVGGGQEPSDGVDSLATLADSIEAIAADERTTDAKLQQLLANSSPTSAEMLEMQMLMNQSSQLSEIFSAVVTARADELAAITRGEKE